MASFRGDSVCPRSWRGSGSDLLDGLYYREITGAPAEIAIHVSNDLFAGWPRIFIEQRFRGQNHSRGAEAALKREVIEKRLLQRMQFLGRFSQAFDGQHALPARFVG